MTLEERLKRLLEKREVEGNLRKLSTQRAPIDFFSNDYLGLSRNEDLRKRIAGEYDAINEKITGATGSRLLSGNYKYYELLENKLAELFNANSSLIFNSGYTANLAIFSSIPQKGDTIIYDELIHACIKEGSRLSFAERYSFKHNNIEDLESKLQKAKGTKFIAIESVYSMDGDFTPLEEIIQLSKKYQAHIILDEAHGTGVFGKHGNGRACELGVEKEIFIRTYTFGKAIGSHGACVVSGGTTIQYLINFARSFIYTTALPLHNLVSIDCAFAYLKEHIHLQEELKKRVLLFKDRLQKALKLNPYFSYIESNSAIQAILVSGNTNAKNLSNELISKGFDVRPILAPTVQEGKERVRICLHAYNSYGQIENLVSCIEKFKF